MAKGGGSSGGGSGGVGELQPHPVEVQLAGVKYCVKTSPHWPETFILGFQHYLVTVGMAVLIPSTLVPIMGGGHKEKAEVIQTILFVTGLNTLLQSFFGTRLPAVIGGSYIYMLPLQTIIFSSRYSFIIDPHERFMRTMRSMQGALIVASLFQMIVGFLGLWRNVVWLMTPLSAVPLVTLVGLGLYQLGFNILAKCVEVGLPQLVLLVFISQYLPRMVSVRRPILERFAVLLSIAIVWVYAHILTVSGAYNHRSNTTQLSCRTDRSGLLSAAPWIKIPHPFQWGKPTFHVGEVFAMMAASFVSLIESTGTFIAISRYGGATPIPPSVLSRGIGWQGVGIFLDGLFGTISGSAVSAENAGLLALTRIGSRRVIQIAAGFMLFFSIFGKFGAIFASIPVSIVAANYCILFAYVASGGLGLLQFCNLNSFRTKFILGFSLFMGFSVPHYFRETFQLSGYYPFHTGSNALNDTVNVIFLSNATIGFAVAFILDCTLDFGDNAVRKDRGFHWWEKFKTDDEEFYSLPCNLNKYFPSV